MPLDLPCQLVATGSIPVNNKFVAVEKNVFYLLGSTRIPLQILKYGNNKNVVMISLHDDETTSVAAAKKVLKKTGGQLIRIENEKKRYITFMHQGKSVRFDPNRIFTRNGIVFTLREQNVSFPTTAIKSVDGFAKFLLKKIPSTHTVIALHNNEDGGLSVHSYAKGGVHEKNAIAVHRNNSYDPDNFFFTTDRRLSRSLSETGYNVVYQNNRKAIDDGSLSIHYGRKHKSYVNIETEDGMQRIQERMIESVVKRVKKR